MVVVVLPSSCRHGWIFCCLCFFVIDEPSHDVVPCGAYNLAMIQTFCHTNRLLAPTAGERKTQSRTQHRDDITMTITRSVLLRATTRALRPQIPRYHQSPLKLHTAVLQKSISTLPCSCRYEKISVTSSLLQQLRFHSAEPAATPIITSEKIEEFVPPSFSALNHLHPNSLRALHKMMGQNATASEIQALLIIMLSTINTTIRKYNRKYNRRTFGRTLIAL